MRVEVFTLSSLCFKALGALWTAKRSKVTVAALMPCQLSVCEESLLAGCAQVRPLASVDSFMANEAGHLGEALLTVGASERPLAIVSQQVPVEDLTLREALPTLCAGVWTLAGVDLPVLIQKPNVCETFPALTCKWPLTSVFHLVSLEVRRPAVYLLTQGAFVLMPHNMFLPVPKPLQDTNEALATFLAFVLTPPFL